MTKVVFYEKDEMLGGFLIKDHSGYDDEGYDIVCASVSSAAYLTANTLTEIVGAKADIKGEEAYLLCFHHLYEHEIKINTRHKDCLATYASANILHRHFRGDYSA